MSARTHRALVVALTFMAFFAPAIAVFLAGEKAFRLLDSMFGRHPLAHGIAFYVLPIVVPVGLMFLVYGTINALVPARCPKCGNRAYRYSERGPWLAFFQNRSERIIYWCSSCRSKEDLGWSEDGP